MRSPSAPRLAHLAATGPEPGSTWPHLEAWDAPAGWRAWEQTVVAGAGSDWDRLRRAVLHWSVKRVAGFRLRPGQAVLGERLELTAAIGPWTVVEPVEVVAVVDEPSRAGFAYATLAGHPVAGEEAFVVARASEAPEAPVTFTVRSLTRPAPEGPWRFAHPMLRLAQVVARRRYLAALR